MPSRRRPLFFSLLFGLGSVPVAAQNDSSIPQPAPEAVVLEDEGPSSVAPPPAKPEPSPEESAPAPIIDIVYPKEGESLGLVDKTFILGNVFPATGTLLLNDTTAPLTDRGQFLQVIEASPGNFRIKAQLFLEEKVVSEAVRETRVDWPPVRPKPGVFSLQAVSPARDLILKPGDWLHVAARGTPGGKMRFVLPGRPHPIPMAEAPPGRTSVYWDDTVRATDRKGGFYEGAVRMRRSDRLQKRKIVFRFSHPRFGNRRASSRGTVSVSEGWRVARVIAESAPARSAPNGGLLFDFPKGTRLRVAGRAGQWLRARLASDRSVWLREKDLEFLPEGTPPPRGRLEMIRTRALPGGAAEIDFHLDPGVPHLIEPSARSLELSFFGTRDDVEFIVYDPADSWIRAIRRGDSSAERTRLSIDLNEKPLWGWSLRRSSGILTLALRPPPAVSKERPLEGLTLVLDPGHQPSKPGAIGALRTLEMDANFDLARRLETVLKREGATVVSTRERPDEEVSLSERPTRAKSAGADLFLSLHYNAMPPGVDPAKTPRGFQIYYFHENARALARSLTEAYGRNLSLPNEGFRFRNYYVLRQTEFPAVLLESAYMMFPDQEVLILDPDFQDRVAGAIVEGLKTHLWKLQR